MTPTPIRVRRRSFPRKQSIHFPFGDSRETMISCSISASRASGDQPGALTLRSVIDLRASSLRPRSSSHRRLSLNQSQLKLLASASRRMHADSSHLSGSRNVKGIRIQTLFAQSFLKLSQPHQDSSNCKNRYLAR